MDSTSKQAFTNLQDDTSSNRIIIIGGGIVGSALAYNLSSSSPNTQIVLLDSSLSNPQGSTAFAPGFVGQLNTISHLTEMAKESVEEYLKIPGAFQQIGGLEIASTEAGIAQLKSRHALSENAGLPSQMLDSAEASKLAPDFVIQAEGTMGRFSPLDGTADPKLITKHYLSEAKSRGVVLLPLKVVSISSADAADHDVGVETELGLLMTKKLIVATGIWTSEFVKPLGLDLPIIPVLHPYAYGPERPARDIKQPFIRWPERHIYARDHGTSDGWGSYDHKPIVCTPMNSAMLDSLIPRYGNKHNKDFVAEIRSSVIDSAMSFFPDGESSKSKTPYRSLNAVFSITPDSLPLAGAVPQVQGLYIASAIWVTSAAGVARLIADIVSEKVLSEGDVDLRCAFDPTRFEGQDPEELKSRALTTYNDIYNKTKH